ncbi:U exon [Bovine adenovirus 7]|uniref:U-exon protein n=1 Tax=Bovine adenovirus 7 TaxID=10511 RepID=A0A7R7IXY7_ADEB7|nr:U exon [Bovine adenovirus 7]URN46039.1 U Exon [Bovine adenovirus 7]BCO10936.1 U-exon protein [Bovine adenovirus 7]BCS90529.1 U-exon protein [Bovine adenovirus 7]
MTEVYFNSSLLLKSDILIPPFKWIKIHKDIQLKLENYGKVILFYGDESKKEKLM